MATWAANALWASSESGFGSDHGPLAGWVAASITNLPVSGFSRLQTATALPLASTATWGPDALWASSESGFGSDHGPLAGWVAASITNSPVSGLSRSQTATA